MTEPIAERQRFTDRAEAHVINTARSDAAYALTMSQRPEVSRDELCCLVAKLAGAVRGVASVADMRGERLNSPAARALEDALRAVLTQR